MPLDALTSITVHAEQLILFLYSGMRQGWGSENDVPKNPVYLKFSGVCFRRRAPEIKELLICERPHEQGYVHTCHHCLMLLRVETRVSIQ